MASIRERPSRTGESTWAVLYRHGGRQSSRTFVSESAAVRFRGLVKALGPERALKALAEEDDENGLTLDEIARKWLAAKEGEVTPNILAGYKRDYERWIKPTFGHRSAEFVDEIDVQDWVDGLKRTHLSPKSIADRHAILHQIFRWACSRTRNLAPHNPCKETELPKRVRSEPKGLRLPELYALLAAARKVDPDAADVIDFMASTGWRLSEALALCVGAVEDDGTNVWVTMERVQRRRVGLTEGGKSRAAMRRIRVIGAGVDVLRRLVVGKRPSDLVFTAVDGRKGIDRRNPWNQTTFRDRRWASIVKEAGLTARKPTPHWLRHTHVAVCHAAGLSLAEIQRRLGHEDIQTTINIYGRMIEEMNDEAASRLDALLTPPKAETDALGGGVVAGEVVAG